MEDGDADLTVGVDVGVPEVGGEGHCWGVVGEVGGEDEAGFEEASFVECAVSVKCVKRGRESGLISACMCV